MIDPKPGAPSLFESFCVPGSLEPMPLSMMNWENIGFAPIVTPFIGGSAAGSDGNFEPYKIVKTGVLKIAPHACALNYGQALFEGLKARRGKDGMVRLFRPSANAARMAQGAERFIMSAPPEKLFISMIVDVVSANKEYIPPYGKGSLYIRPLLLGAGSTLQPAPSDTTLFIAYAQPVGVYFKGTACITVKADDRYQRAASKGTGWVKAAGNYAPCFLPAREAKEEGYSDVLFLNHDGDFVEEVGGANFAMVSKGKLFVADSPSILKGITRDSAVRIAREILGLEVVFDPLEIDRVIGEGKFAGESPADEAFCMGTAAAISPIGSMRWRGKTYTFGDGGIGPITQKIYDILDEIQTGIRTDPFGWTMIVE